MIFNSKLQEGCKTIKFLGFPLYIRKKLDNERIVQLFVPFAWGYLAKSLKTFNHHKWYVAGLQICCFKRPQKRAQYYKENYQKFIEYLYQENKNRKKHFVPITSKPFKRLSTDTKVIAYYLPQYYKMEINDKFHGKGFTEWTNSSQAMPLFIGHEQPHIPYDVGYYDLLNPDAFKRQTELAKMYGVYGFCMHWYWFSGQRTMEKPLELLLAHPEIDIRYCFNWATENWTALWDGGNKELMFEQKLQNGDDEKLFNDLLPYFKDSRYIRIDDKPVFSIYNIRIFEKDRAKLLLANLRKYAKRAGFKDLYILIANSFYFDEDVAEWGADALVEFPPSWIKGERFVPAGYVYPSFKGYIHDAQGIISTKCYLKSYKSKKVFRSAMVSWDNTARKGYSKHCGIFHGLNPSTFKIWLNDIVKESKKLHAPSEDIVFVNSWNEWAEGSHLEPCMRYGYGYLQAVKEVLEYNRPPDEEILLRQIKKAKSKPVKFVVHCIESFGDIVACEPIARWLKKQVPHATVSWIVKKQYCELIAHNPNIDQIIEVDCLSESIDICHKRRETGAIIIDCHYNGRICSHTHRVHSNLNNPMINEQTYFNYGGILETFCLSAGMPALKDAPVFWERKNLSLPKGFPKKYIVLHCKSAERIKDWSDAKWNKLASQLMREGYDIVEIGLQKTIHANNEHYIDCTSITDFQQLAHIIKHSSCFCSVDSGFAHIANSFSIPSCILIGKYKTFDRPFPYTGFFASHLENILYAEDASANEIAVSAVIERIKFVMGK